MRGPQPRRGMTLIEVLVMVAVLLTLLGFGLSLYHLIANWHEVQSDLQQTELWQWALFIALVVARVWWNKRDRQSE